MARYQRNNLLFRIVSSDAISKFKAAQAESFLQLTRKELDFEEPSREAVLLEFDRLSNWIFRVEKMCVSVEETSVPLSVRKIIYDSLIEEFSVIEGVMESNTEVFEKEIIDFVKSIHTYTKKILLADILQAKNLKPSNYFADVVAKINQYLQHLMVSMHEYNSNIIKKVEQPFLCVTDFCINISDEKNRNLPCDARLNYFLDHGSRKEFILKNYSDADVFDEFTAKFDEKGIKIIKEQLTEIA